MSTVIFILRTHARRSWVAWVGVGLVLAVTAGVAMAGMAGARRMASAYPRYLASAKAPDMVVEPPFDPSGQVSDPTVLQRIADTFVEEVERLPQVRSVSVSRGTTALLPGAGGLPDVGKLIDALSSMNGRYLSTDRAAVLSGRLPDPRRADEVLVDRNFAEHHRVGPGSTVRLWLVTDQSLSPDAPPAALAAGSHLETFHITGVGVMTDEVLQDDIARVDRVVFTPAFARANPSTLGFTRVALLLRHGRTDIPAVQQAVQRIGTTLLPDGDVPVEVESTVVDRTQRAIRPLAVALGAFSLLLALAIALIVAPLLGRAVRLRPRERGTLRALGATSTQQVMVPALAAGAVGVASAGVAVAVAIGLRPFAPLGVVRDVEPQPGVNTDWTILAGGAALLVCAAVATAVVGARRDIARVTPKPRAMSEAAAAAAIGMRPPAVVGIGAALDPGQGVRPPPVRAALAGITLAVTFVVVVVTFGASLGNLSRTPALYGWRWDLLIQSQSGYGYVDLDQYRAALRAIPGVQAATAVSYDKVSVDGADVSALGLDNLIGRVPLALDQGQMPRDKAEAVLGSSTLALLHRAVGQEVRVSAGRSSVLVRVVGRATFPAIGRADAQRTGLGEGIAMTGPGMSAVSASSYPNAVLVDVAPGALGRSAAATIYRRYNVGLSQVLTDQRSADIVDYDRIDVAPTVLAGVLGLVALSALVYSLAASTRARRRDLALLNALGFTRWQVREAVMWQASVVVSIALIVGLPLGILGGRLIWSAFADQVGAPAGSVVPWAILASVTVGAIVVANLAALAPATAAARTKPAAVLRAE